MSCPTGMDAAVWDSLPEDIRHEQSNLARRHAIARYDAALARQLDDGEDQSPGGEILGPWAPWAGARPLVTAGASDDEPQRKRQKLGGDESERVLPQDVLDTLGSRSRARSSRISAAASAAAAAPTAFDYFSPMLAKNWDAGKHDAAM